MNLIKIFEKSTSIKIPYKFANSRLCDVKSSYADVKKAKKILEWQAQKTLEEMCQDAWRWESSNE